MYKADARGREGAHGTDMTEQNWFRLRTTSSVSVRWERGIELKASNMDHDRHVCRFGLPHAGGVGLLTLLSPGPKVLTGRSVKGENGIARFVVGTADHP